MKIFSLDFSIYFVLLATKDFLDTYLSIGNGNLIGDRW